MDPSLGEPATTGLSVEDGGVLALRPESGIRYGHSDHASQPKPGGESHTCLEKHLLTV